MGRRALILALALAVHAGCAPTEKRDDPVATLESGCAAYEAGRLDEAVRELTAVLASEDAEARAHRAEAFYWRGLAEVGRKRPGAARADFEQALAADPPPELRGLARIALGNLAFEEGRDADAVAAYGEALQDPPEGPPMERVALRLAIALQRLGRWTEADTYLAYVMEHYRGTPAAAEARRRYRARGFAVQTGAYASPANAQVQAAKLRGAGLAPTIVRATGGGRTLHTVRVGKVSTYGEAAALATRVNRAGFTALIVP